MRWRIALWVAAAVVLTGLVAVPAAEADRAAALDPLCLVSTRGGLEHTIRVPAATVELIIASTSSYRGPCADYGESADLGDGEQTAYSQVLGSRPVAVGLVISDRGLDNLPYDPPNEGLWCYDKNGDGRHDRMTECAGGYESALQLDATFREQVDTPLRYVLTNWNPMGHPPPDVYNQPHFDVHFYLNSNAERLAICPGPCPALVHCDDYQLGKDLPDPRYVAPDYVDLDAIEPAMGNHLIDPTGPEFNGEEFTHTFIYGSWDDEITFYEPMVTLGWLKGLRHGTVDDQCFDLKLPAAWQESGWYPTQYCLRHRENRDELTVSMETFVYRTAG